MKVFCSGIKESKGTHTLMVQPGNEYPDNTNFKTEAGHPIIFEVRFLDGVAEVDNMLGRYLLDKNLASTSPIVHAA